MKNSVTHVAGPTVGISSINRALQRCAVCGEKLCDNKNQQGAIGPNGELPKFLTFSEGHLIRVSGQNPKQFVDVGDFRDDSVPVPDDFCLELVE